MSKLWQKECLEPHATHLATGVKQMEGRIHWKDWRLMRIGDVLEITAVPTEMVTRYRIVAIDKAPSFAELWKRHGSKLLPNAQTLDDVAHTYYTECRYKPEDERENGVICLHLDPIR